MRNAIIINEKWWCVSIMLPQKVKNWKQEAFVAVLLQYFFIIMMIITKRGRQLRAVIVTIIYCLLPTASKNDKYQSSCPSSTHPITKKVKKATKAMQSIVIKLVPS